MSVLDRKMFKKVAKLKHGGNPYINHNTGQPIPFATGVPGGLNPVDTSIFQTGQYENTATPLQDSSYQGIIAGLNEFQPIANQFASELFPEKSAEQYAAEAKMLYQKDFSAEKESIETQKQQDVASSLINFGARLLTGRGKALDVLGQAVQATVPEFTAARRATRKEETEVRAAERAVDAQRRTYALTKQQEDAVTRANIISQAMFSNLGFLQETEKLKKKNALDANTTFKLVNDRTTNLNTEITLAEYIKDLELPENERKYTIAKDYNQPFIAYDNTVKENKFFSTYEEFALAVAAEPTRYDTKRDFREKDWKRVINLTTKKIEFVESDKLDPNVHVPTDDTEYVLATDNQNNNKEIYLPKNMPFDTGRFTLKQDAVEIFKDFVMGSFTHPDSGEYGNYQIKELKNGEYLIPKLDANGDAILQANGQPIWIPIGNGIADLTVNQKVAMTADDVLPKKALTEQLSTIQLYDRNIFSIDTVISNLIKDPSTAGLPGLIQDIKQRGFGMIADLLAAEDQISILTNTLQNVQQSFGDGLIETFEGSGEFVNVNDFFDPNSESSQQFWGDFKPQLAENRVRINAIAYALARARKSSGRLNLDDIRRAYESLKITGFIDSKTVIAGLITVREELRLANNDLKVLYEFNKGTYPSGYQSAGTINVTNMPKMAYDPETKTFSAITFPEEVK